MKKQLILFFLISIGINVFGQTLVGSLINPTGDDGDPYWWIKFGKTSDAWGGLMWNNNAAYYGNGDDFTIYTYGNRDINFQTGSGNVIFFPSSTISGNIGIGVTDPVNRLHVYDNRAGYAPLVVQNSNPSGLGLLVKAGAGSAYVADFRKADNTTLVRIDGYGNIGIGDNNPWAPLTLKKISNDNKNEGVALASSGADYSAIGYRFKANGSNYYQVLYNGSEIQWKHFDGSNYVPRMILKNNGNVAIQGKLEAKEIKVQLLPTADFVFNDNYELKEIQEVESFIKENRHLPDFPSANEIEENGVNLGEMDAKLLQKIEELTLYMIDQNKRIEKLEKENKLLKEKVNLD